MIGKATDAAFYSCQNDGRTDLFLAIRHELDKAIEAGDPWADFKDIDPNTAEEERMWGQKRT